jgi:hypothetical protein
MSQRDSKPTADDDPTCEQGVPQFPEFDAARTDQLDDKYRVHVVSASEADSGAAEFDDGGEPRSKHHENPPSRDMESTWDLLKALENAAIVVEEPTVPVPQQKPEPSCNPYDTSGTAKAKRKR